MREGNENRPTPYKQGSNRNIVVRTVDHEFWTHLLFSRLSQRRKRVVAVGTPAIGKTTTAAYAIRCLLEQGKTVVYLERTEDKSSHYIEFVPEQSRINLFPEMLSPSNIPSLSNPET